MRFTQRFDRGKSNAPKGRLMAAQLPDSNDDTLISSINVTPFVDVVLVLLVIFMVTAPIIAKDLINLKLPKTESGDGKGMSTLGVAINKDGQILLNGIPVSEESLASETKRAISEDNETQAIIAADVDTPYGRVAKVIDLIKSAGLEKFAIQIERETAR
jgi:biopolymer transport protein TolR